MKRERPNLRQRREIERDLRREIDPTNPAEFHGCTRKRGQYLTRERAKTAARHAKLKHGVDYRVYQCQYCLRWHIATARSVKKVPEVVIEIVKTEPIISLPTLRSLAGATVKKLIRRARP